VFHNDVIAVANEDVLFCHSSAFADSRAVDEMRRAFARCAEGEPVILAVSEEQLPVSEAVESYLFNSQLVTLPEGGMVLIAPSECRGKERVREVLRQIVAADNPVRTVRYVNVRQSMRNGGGPACLRLRVVLSEENLAAVHQGVLLTETLYDELVRWVERHYRERLVPKDLADRELLNESRSALDELTGLLGLGSIYQFQRAGS
jgi:succinylarginine dihydrolase